MTTLSQDLRTEAALIAGNGLTRKRNRQRVAGLMLRCADWMADAEADARRLDWLADPTNAVGNVQLPRACVERNLHSLRAAIDDAMKLPAPSNA